MDRAYVTPVLAFPCCARLSNKSHCESSRNVRPHSRLTFPWSQGTFAAVGHRSAVSAAIALQRLLQFQAKFSPAFDSFSQVGRVGSEPARKLRNPDLLRLCFRELTKASSGRASFRGFDLQRMNCPCDPPEDARRRRSVFVADHSPQRVARHSQLHRRGPLAERIYERFQFGNVPARRIRVRAVRNVRPFVRSEIILFFPAVRLLPMYSARIARICRRRVGPRS